MTDKQTAEEYARSVTGDSNAFSNTIPVIPAHFIPQILTLAREEERDKARAVEVPPCEDPLESISMAYYHGVAAMRNAIRALGEEGEDASKG